MREHLGWAGIVRLGLVQSALGAIVMLATSLLNRVMVVEYALAALIPGALVAWHYVVQLSRPRFGHGSDRGTKRTPWIILGMGLLAMGALLAVDATLLSDRRPVLAILMATIGYAMIGAGVGAAGTSLLALLATRTAPERRSAAAAIAWIMMVAGIAGTAGVTSQLLEPFSPQRLATVAGGVALGAFLVALIALWGVERGGHRVLRDEAARSNMPFRAALTEVWAEPLARQFTIFVGLSMVAYAMQDMILEPFAGLVFGWSPAQTTALSGMQHGGVLLGMILTGLLGARLRRLPGFGPKGIIFVGCLGSAVALAGLGVAAAIGPGWPLHANVVALGLFNGIFAVAAVGAMFEFAGEGAGGREGVRVGLWGAAQAMAFAAANVLSTSLVDISRAVMGAAAPAYGAVFTLEALLFVAAAVMALRLAAPHLAAPRSTRSVTLAGESL